MMVGGGRKFMSDINVTPFVDVMLVLLIIFMVTAPMMRHGMDVSLPKTSADAVASEKERLVITITKERKVFIDEFETDMDSFRQKLEHIYQAQSDREAFLRADESLPYGFVAQVLSQIRQAGVLRLGMITEPIQARK